MPADLAPGVEPVPSAGRAADKLCRTVSSVRSQSDSASAAPGPSLNRASRSSIVPNCRRKTTRMVTTTAGHASELTNEAMNWLALMFFPVH